MLGFAVCYASGRTCRSVLPTASRRVWSAAMSTGPDDASQHEPPGSSIRRFFSPTAPTREQPMSVDEPGAAAAAAAAEPRHPSDSPPQPSPASPSRTRPHSEVDGTDSASGSTSDSSDDVADSSDEGAAAEPRGRGSHDPYATLLTRHDIWTDGVPRPCTVEEITIKAQRQFFKKVARKVVRLATCGSPARSTPIHPALCSC